MCSIALLFVTQQRQKQQGTAAAGKKAAAAAASAAKTKIKGPPLMWPASRPIITCAAIEQVGSLSSHNKCLVWYKSVYRCRSVHQGSQGVCSIPSAQQLDVAWRQYSQRN